MGWNWKEFLRGSINRGNVRNQRRNIRGKNFHTSGNALTTGIKGGQYAGVSVTNLEPYGPGHSFQSHIATTQLARTERFECRFQFPEQVVQSGSSFPLKCTLMAEEVQVPGMVLTNKEYNVGNWTHTRNTNMQFLGNEINITFYTDANWEHRAIFESWMSFCVNATSKEVRLPQHTWGQISINALDIQNNYRSSWELYRCTPKVLNLIPMSMGATGVVRTTLIISAEYWESKAIEVGIGDYGGKNSGANASTTIEV